MHIVVEKLTAELSRHGLKSSRLLLAVSGGADSVALLRGCLELRNLVPGLHVAHLNHQLRGDASRADAEWIREICARLGVAASIGECDVAAESTAAGIGIEEAARTARYRFLSETAVRVGCLHIAVAHTADDQAETILHHILRGTGLAGLRGIPPTRALDGGLLLLRPLLDVTRADVLDYLKSIEQDFRDDSSNADESFTRNRIRRQLIPELTADYNAHLPEALRKLGRQAREVHDTIAALAADLLNEAIDSRAPNECKLHWKVLLGHPRHIVREVFTQLWKQQNWPRQKMDFDHWDRLVETAWHGGAVTLPGNIDARHAGLLLVLRQNRGGESESG